MSPQVPGSNQTQIAARQELHVGPLPSPDVLARFDQVMPGLAERIVKMAEGNSQDRWRTNRAVRFAIIAGQVFAFVVVMTGIVGGLILINQGKSVEGLTSLIVAVSGVVIAFITRQFTKHRDSQ